MTPSCTRRLRILTVLGSDVLAELDLPPSGISRLEDSMMLPGAVSSPSPFPETQEEDSLMWMYYLAQIALRKLLNRVHTALYKQGQRHAYVFRKPFLT